MVQAEVNLYGLDERAVDSFFISIIEVLLVVVIIVIGSVIIIAVHNTGMARVDAKGKLLSTVRKRRTADYYSTTSEFVSF